MKEEDAHPSPGGWFGLTIDWRRINGAPIRCQWIGGMCEIPPASVVLGHGQKVATDTHTLLLPS